MTSDYVRHIRTIVSLFYTIHFLIHTKNNDYIKYKLPNHKNMDMLRNYSIITGVNVNFPTS